MHSASRYILLAAVFLSGCATPNVDKDYVLNADSGKGLLVMSLTHVTDNIIVDYRGKSKGRFMTGTVQYPVDWESPYGRLVVAELPAGRYEFYQWHSGRKYLTYIPTPFSIPFMIAAGKVSYVGNIYISINDAKKMYDVDITDQSDKDFPLMLHRFNKIRRSDIFYNIPVKMVAH